MDKQEYLEKQEELHYVMKKKERKKEGKTKNEKGMNHVKRKKIKKRRKTRMSTVPDN